MTTAADELRAASARLRDLTTALGDCRGPWYVVNREQRPYPQRIDNIGMPYIVASTTTDPSHPPTIADYICAMHPGVGKALADHLEALADLAAAYPEMAHDHDRPGCQDYTCDVMGSGIALARQINTGRQA